MTRDDLISLAKELLFEDATGESALATTTQLQGHINRANSRVLTYAAKSAPGVFRVFSADTTYSASTGYYDLSLLDANGVYFLLGVDVKDGDDYRPLDFLDEREALRYAQIPYSGASLPFAFWLDGSRVRLVPSVAADQTLRYSYVPRLPVMAAGSTEALGGKLPDFHELVAYEAALVLAAKDEASVGFAAVKVLRDERKAELLKHLSRRTGAGRFIREVRFA